jgi:murein L,D-transpeptidase YcbB/YkuD
MEGSEVKVLQERLACEGLYEGPINGRYGDLTLSAVKNYQEHHELDADGYVFTGTIKSMNVPLSRRLAQIDLALRRIREYTYRDLGDPYIRVNVPLYEIQIVEGGKVTRRHRAIVGSNRLDDNKVKLLQGHINRTEIFRTRLYEAIVHPDWILPLRVERGEVKAKLAEDPNYLKKSNIIEQTLPSGKKVLIQRSGAGNVLGKVKFLLERSRAIFLHDTNKPDLFEKKRRDFSHGCMRVDRALDFANWVLVQDGWDPKEVRRSLLSDKTQRGMALKKPLDLITEYITVDVAHDGNPVFLTDIYGYDKAFLQGDVPPTVTMLWGSNPMRPHWVPRVPEEVVLKWKAAGKQAPHNYDPMKDQ